MLSPKGPAYVLLPLYSYLYDMATHCQLGVWKDRMYLLSPFEVLFLPPPSSLSFSLPLSLLLLALITGNSSFFLSHCSLT